MGPLGCSPFEQHLGLTYRQRINSPNYVSQVVTDAANANEAWQKLLNRNFKGLEKSRYQSRFETGIADAYLREQALRSIRNAGDEQQLSYDFSSASANKTGGK